MRYHIKMISGDVTFWLCKDGEFTHWTSLLSEAMELTQAQVPEAFIRASSRIQEHEKLLIVRKQMTPVEKFKQLKDCLAVYVYDAGSTEYNWQVAIKAIGECIDRINRNAN